MTRYCAGERLSLTRHTVEHLQQSDSLDQLPLKCTMVSFCNNITRPSFCPECLGDGRFHQMTNGTEWKTHVIHHVGSKVAGAWSGHHPAYNNTEKLSQPDVHSSSYMTPGSRSLANRLKKVHPRVGIYHTNPPSNASTPGVDTQKQ